MVKLYTFSFLLFILLSQISYGQNEFYNNGAIVILNTGDASSTPTLYVKGNFINQDGDFRNTSSFLEVTGNITNNPTTFHYTSTGIERMSGTADQTIKGTWNGTASNQDQFYNLKINKSSTTGENIILDDALAGNTLNVNPAGSLAFESSNGIIRTQTTSVGSSDATSTGDYLNKIYLQNSDPAKFTGYSVGVGATTKYIEGKLQQQLIAGKSYYYPIGFKKLYVGGMNAFNLDVTSISTSTAVVGFVKPYSTALVTSSYTYCDVAKVDNLPATPNNFSTCTGGPDGIMDQMRLTTHTFYSWDVTPDVAPATVNYDISVYPTPRFDASATFTAIPCGPFPEVRYLARNGIPGGNLATLGPSPTFGNTIGYFMYVTGNSLPSQTGFSNYQLWGANDANTNLPVELTKFFITPKDNLYFNLNWQTASELNNSGFYLERSVNGGPFVEIGWVAGNGTSNNLHDYSFSDHNVTAGIVYYYRLRQVDFDQTFKYSNTLSGILDGQANFNVLTIMPNPTTLNPTANIYSPLDGNLQMSIYDVLGQQLKSTTVSLNKGINNVNIDLSNLATANYLVKFNYNDVVVTKKIIKR